MARLLEDLLDVSRITRGQFTLQREPMDLRGVIDSVLESMEPFRRSNEATIDVRESETVVPIFGDGARLHQVVANLVSNALRYSPRGSLVRVSLEKMGNTAILRVVDDGRGIDGSLMPKIFDLFVQSDQAIDRQEGGLGVGLTLVREIVRAHGGTVESHSDGQGRGSEFVVRLPMCDASELEHRGGAQPSEGPASCKRVVVVEDQEDARQMLRLLLESRGHTVIAAEDGPAGLEAITNHKPDLALVDLGLPTMSGFEVARAVREAMGANHVLLVALSGYGASEDVERAIDAGFDAHITKPADPDRLEELLARD
jgi:CheY-like chemotaxis protein